MFQEELGFASLVKVCPAQQLHHLVQHSYRAALIPDCPNKHFQFHLRLLCHGPVCLLSMWFGAHSHHCSDHFDLFFCHGLASLLPMGRSMNSSRVCRQDDFLFYHGLVCHISMHRRADSYRCYHAGDSLFFHGPVRFRPMQLGQQSNHCSKSADGPHLRRHWRSLCQPCLYRPANPVTIATGLLSSSRLSFVANLLSDHRIGIALTTSYPLAPICVPRAKVHETTSSSTTSLHEANCRPSYLWWSQSLCLCLTSPWHLQR
mmetsp:Transcript_107214/g.169277  ORF Transcript_107214/g.169277 Transcript_107214/m.169277 type:complete len:260 (-) Transcript_107214:213-992(-)